MVQATSLHDWLLWVLVFAGALHVVEEHALGWQGWAAGTFGRRFGVHPSWSDFWVTNAAFIVFGVAAASVGWAAPAFALALPAVCVINALGFHVLPSLTARRPNPGVFTALGLYLPLGVWCFVAARQDDVLDVATLLGSLALGAVVMASAIVFLVLGRRLAYADA